MKCIYIQYTNEYICILGRFKDAFVCSFINEASPISHKLCVIICP